MVGPAATALQSVDPTLVLDQSGLVRAVAAFAIVSVLGWGILWRYDDVVERSISDAVDRPLAALGYGIAAHLTIAFFGAYAASQLGQLTLSGRSLGGLGIWAGLFILVVVGSLGFTVVGTALVQYGWDRPRWYGPLVGAVIAGLAALPEPIVGGLVWLIVVSTGIGGRVRVWFHAADDVAAAE